LLKLRVTQQQVSPLTSLTHQLLITTLLVGVYHLHCERFIHRDIAARNVLLDDQWNAMVSDFSLSRILSPGMAGHKTVSAFGPIKWMPPEALLQQHYSSKSDAYSFGIFLWELVRYDSH
jgi:serine/threonine protein kinase